MNSHHFRNLVLAVLMGCVGYLGVLVTPLRAHAQNSPLMEQAKQLYEAKQWDQALYTLQKELRRLRGQPNIQKVPVYIYIGLSLYQKGNPGLAWKAFEQALYIDRDALFPPGQGAKLEAFFNRVRQRVNERLGAPESSVKKQKSGSPTGPSGPATGTVSPWPWVLLSVSAAALTGGILLVINASSNQGQLDQFLTNGVALGQLKADLETSSESLRSTIGLQNAIGAVALSVGGAGVIGAVVLFVLQGRSQPKPPAQSANPAPLATSPTILLQMQ